MKLKLKDKYYEFSIGGGSLQTIKLGDIDPLLYEDFYKRGFTEFFEIEDEESLDENEFFDENNIEEDDIN